MKKSRVIQSNRQVKEHHKSTKNNCFANFDTKEIQNIKKSKKKNENKSRKSPCQIQREDCESGHAEVAKVLFKYIPKGRYFRVET